MIEEALDSPGFWILGGGAVTAELLGWIMSKRAGWEALPFWQLALLMLGTLIASAFFATRE